MPVQRKIEDLQAALDQGAISPYFQPILELKTGQICAFEVLARRIAPNKSANLPHDMILLAEGSGLIGRVTESLLRQTAELARTLPSPMRFAINISPKQLCGRGFAEDLEALIGEIGLDFSQLTIEITESALLDNFDRALSVSRQLKSFGAQLALDDFGTGYSSLRNLQALPFDELKIDGSYVKQMSERRESRKIVAAVVGLGHSLSMRTVAEGIETTQQAEMLFYLGCSRGQGWLYSRALSAEEVPGYLARIGGINPVLPPSESVSGATIGTMLEVLPAQRLSQLQAIYDGAPVGLCFLDQNLRYVSLNRRFAETNKIPVEHHLGRMVSEVIPERFAQLEPHLLRALQGEAVTDLEITYPDPARPDGLQTQLVSYEPARDEAGEVIGISCTAVDITERKRIENALRASIDHYWRATGTSPQIAWTADARGNLIDISPRWEIITGFKYEDVIEGRWIDSVHTEDRPRIVEWWGKSIRSGKPMDMLFRLETKGGGWLWMRASGAARCASDGTILRWYGMLEVIDGRGGEYESDS